MNWTLLLTLEPVSDARLVEFTQALQPCQFHPNLVLFHADGAFLRSPVAPNAVLFSRGEMEHANGWFGLRMTGPGVDLRMSTKPFDAPVDVRLSCLLTSISGSWWKYQGAHGAKILVIDALVSFPHWRPRQRPVSCRNMCAVRVRVGVCSVACRCWP